jgi:hypothetical protein
MGETPDFNDFKFRIEKTQIKLRGTERVRSAEELNLQSGLASLRDGRAGVCKQQITWELRPDGLGEANEGE